MLNKIHFALLMFTLHRVLLAVPDLLRCCVVDPGRQLYRHLLGDRGEQLLEVVAQAGDAARAVGGPRFIPRPVPRYGPPPGSLPVLCFSANSSRPSTSRAVRSLLECRMEGRSGPVPRLILGELRPTNSRAEVGWSSSDTRVLE
jgi:hypothetical protein